VKERVGLHQPLAGHERGNQRRLGGSEELGNRREHEAERQQRQQPLVEHDEPQHEDCAQRVAHDQDAPLVPVIDEHARRHAEQH
jgi:hypothetical protein